MYRNIVHVLSEAHNFELSTYQVSLDQLLVRW